MGRREREAASESADPDPERRFRESDGVDWRVRERGETGRPPALYFEAEMAFRRVAHYPLDGRVLPTEALEILSHAT